MLAFNVETGCYYSVAPAPTTTEESSGAPVMEDLSSEVVFNYTMGTYCIMHGHITQLYSYGCIIGYCIVHDLIGCGLLIGFFRCFVSSIYSPLLYC